MKKRIADEQIVRILHEAESGLSACDLCHKHKISEQTSLRWKNKYGGMDVSDVKCFKAPEYANSELNRMVDKQALDIRMLQDVSSKNSGPYRPSMSRHVSAVGLRGPRAFSLPSDEPPSLLVSIPAAAPGDRPPP